MTKVTTEQTQEKRLQELVVYHIVSEDFLYPGIVYRSVANRPDPFNIANEYGCKIELREGQFKNLSDSDPICSSYNLSHFPIDKNGRCLSAVIIGKDIIRLVKTREAIHRLCGVERLDLGGFVDVSEKRAYN
ncbi:hypothetical protein J4466_01540 [Candidatus Pacearchaeota archaeon]|nr:hypothetical protein [Candidatus Pacearchaeota archaeon]